MEAKIGDRLVAGSADGSPSCAVRWLEADLGVTVLSGRDAIVVTAPIRYGASE